MAVSTKAAQFSPLGNPRGRDNTDAMEAALIIALAVIITLGVITGGLAAIQFVRNAGHRH